MQYFVTGEALKGGFELGYLPTWHLWGSGSGFTAPLAPLSWSREAATLGARAGLGYVSSGRLSIISRFEATSYFRVDYDKDPNGWLGAEVALQLLYNRVRISGNVDLYHALEGAGADPSAARWGPRGWSIRAGLSDLNGIAYWIVRAL